MFCRSSGSADGFSALGSGWRSVNYAVVLHRTQIRKGPAEAGLEFGGLEGRPAASGRPPAEAPLAARQAPTPPRSPEAAARRPSGASPRLAAARKR